MGSGTRLKCPKCSKSYEFNTGIGFLFSSISLMDINYEHNLISMYEDGIDKDKLIRIMPRGVLNDGYGLRVFQCPKCKEYSNRIYFEVEDGEEKFVSSYKCNKCNKNLEQAKEPYKCPKCNVKLEIDGFVLWD